jgi:DNA-binding CsgD family transcriptional regulator
MLTLNSMRRVWAQSEWSAARPSQQARQTKVESPLQPSDVGFLLLNSSLLPIYANHDAVRILCYPRTPKPSKAALQAIKKRVHSLLRDHRPSPGDPSLVEFSSDKRRYLVRAFHLDAYTQGPLQPAYALLIERGHHVMLDLAQISNQYGLTSRENETMRLLLGGLTSKEIASRMEISPNTVKVFLRLIMLKMGVTTRAGIIGKFVSG